MTSDNMQEAMYLKKLREENVSVNAIADAALTMLRSRRTLKGNQAVLTEEASVAFCKYLLDKIKEGSDSTRIAAERLLRKEMWYAYDLGYSEVIYMIEPQIAMIDL